MGKDCKLDAIVVYPTEGDAYMELHSGDKCFAEIRVSNGELVVDFFGEVRNVPASWMKSTIERAVSRAMNKEGKVTGFKMGPEFWNRSGQ